MNESYNETLLPFPADEEDPNDLIWLEEFRDSSRFWVQRVLVPIVVIVGVLGNLVTIYILTRRPMRSSTNVYLCALAVSDMLFLLFTFSMSLAHYPNIDTSWLYWWYKPVGLWLTDAASSTSVWLTVSFTIERYIAVCHPMRGKILCTEERAIKVAVLVYLICFAVTSPTPFEWTIANSTNIYNETTYRMEPSDFGKNESYRMFYHWFSSVSFILLPVVILAIFNFFLIQAVRRSRIARKSMTNQQSSSVRHLQTMRQENRITMTLIVVVIVFLICQLPTAAVLIFTSFSQEPSLREDYILRGLGNIFNLLVALNAACNFLLYTALSDKYRKYFCAFFFCWRKPQYTNHYDGNPYELDTMNTTLSLSRGTSLRMDMNSTRSPFKGSVSGNTIHGGGLRRTATCNTSRGHLEGSGSGSTRRNIHINMKEANIPLIQVDQV